MILKNRINKEDFTIDPRFKKNIDVRTTVEISQDIKDYFLLSTWALAEQLEAESIKIDKICRCIFTNSDEVAFEIKHDVKAYFTSMCIYAINKWDDIFNIQDEGIRIKKIFCIILEELCHCFFNIHDEVDVCYKVLETEKRIFADITLSDIYSLNEIERLRSLK